MPGEKTKPPTYLDLMGNRVREAGRSLKAFRRGIHVKYLKGTSLPCSFVVLEHIQETTTWSKKGERSDSGSPYLS